LAAKLAIFRDFSVRISKKFTTSARILIFAVSKGPLQFVLNHRAIQPELHDGLYWIARQSVLYYARPGTIPA